MVENPTMVLDDMGSAALTSSGEEENDELDKMGNQKISVLDETNSDSFVLDMERFSHLTDKETTANSRITLQRTRKWQGRVGLKKTNSTATKEKDNSVDPTSSTIRGSVSTLGEAIAVPVGATDHHHHHQITVVTGNIGNTTPTNAERYSSSRRWRIISPRRIFMMCAILSSIGSLLMIYFTLSLGNLSGED